jgi:[acyl-carrier-protein] S-malonyltransferase
MAVASDGLRQALADASFGVPAFPIYANVTAQPVTDATVARQLLLEQLSTPVRWTATIRALAERFPDALFLELGPGAVLTNLVRRSAPGLATATCGTADEVDDLLARLS